MRLRSYVHYEAFAQTVAANANVVNITTLITPTLSGRPFGRLLIEFILESTTDVNGFMYVTREPSTVRVNAETLPAVATAGNVTYTRMEMPISPDGTTGYSIRPSVDLVIRHIVVTEIVGDIQASFA